MGQAARVKDVGLPTLVPGFRMNASPTDYVPFKEMQMRRFDGTRGVRFGEMMARR